MKTRINCEVFRASTGPRLYEFRLGKGLPITEEDDQLFIDPQKRTHGFLRGNYTDPQNLHLQFSEADAPEVTNGYVRKLSLSSKVLQGTHQSGELDRFRAHAPIESAIGNYALLGLTNPYPHIYKPAVECENAIVLDSFRSWSDESTDFSLMLIPEGEEFLIAGSAAGSGKLTYVAGDGIKNAFYRNAQRIALQHGLRKLHAMQRETSELTSGY